MMENVVERVAQWLKQGQHINAPPDWLEACISWIQEEHGQCVTYRHNELNNLVLEQWLLSDLKETGALCLPSDILQQNKYLLRGNFCLQVNSIKEIGCSYYSQLQKVQGTENENVQVTAATQFSQWNYDSKNSTRMLMLQLTDGTIDVQGIEYSHIREFNVDMKLGCKIIVHGEVLCRLGVLMLKPENVMVLGGEVDSFAMTQEEMLKSELTTQEAFKQDPKTATFNGSGQNVKSNKRTSKKDIGSVPSTNFSNTSKNYNSGKQTEFHENMDINWEDDDFDDNLLLEQVDIPDRNRTSLSTNETATVQANTNRHRSSSEIKGRTNLTSFNSNIRQPNVTSDRDQSSFSNKYNLQHNQHPECGKNDIKPEISVDEEWDIENEFMLDSFEDMAGGATHSETNVSIPEVKQEETSHLTYIVKFKQNMNSAMKQKFKIKAYISTLLSKLDFNNGRCWSLIVKLNDGTEVLDVSICNDVLCGLIGYTAEECLEVKNKGTKSDKISLAQGLKLCQEHLIEMSPILEIEVGGDLDRPCVVKIIELSQEEHLMWFSAGTNLP